MNIFNLEKPILLILIRTHAEALPFPEATAWLQPWGPCEMSATQAVILSFPSPGNGYQFSATWRGRSPSSPSLACLPGQTPGISPRDKKAAFDVSSSSQPHGELY